jgi:FAD/FMN-containing dehydrogenase
VLTQEAIDGFRAKLGGQLIQPEDEGYGEARKVYNGMIDRRPRLIAGCSDVADVITAVDFGRENQLLVAVRSGGHNAGGLGAAQMGKSDTAWSYRDAVWAQVIVGVDPDPGNKERIVTWATDYWHALHPHSAGGAYVNFMMDEEGEDRVKASYRENYERLVAVKNKYDPGNFFRVNQNINPVRV